MHDIKRRRMASSREVSSFARRKLPGLMSSASSARHLSAAAKLHRARAALFKRHGVCGGITTKLYMLPIHQRASLKCVIIGGNREMCPVGDIRRGISIMLGRSEARREVKCRPVSICTALAAYLVMRPWLSSWRQAMAARSCISAGISRLSCIA